jgi:hypothetical protein
LIKGSLQELFRELGEAHSLHQPLSAVIEHSINCRIGASTPSIHFQKTGNEKPC